MSWEDGSFTPQPVLMRMAEIAAGHLGEMSDVQKARGLNELVAGVHHAQIDKRHRRRIWLAVTASAAALAIAAIVTVFLSAKPLTYVVSDGEIQPSGYIHSDAGKVSSLHFSDGTNLALMAGTRGRVATADAHGARVMLDEGELRVHVVPRPNARWLFDAGPFSVHVHGTEFTLAWHANNGRLDVQLRSGAVTVTGPLSDGGIVLRPGQWLTVRLAEREVFVREIDSDATSPAPAIPPAPTPLTDAIAPAEAPRATVDEPKPRARARLAPATRLTTSSWGPARSESDWKRIYELARQYGFEQTLAERSSEDLAIFADAAHYLRHDDLAERALLAQRQRFVGTTRAKDAAFLLGRIVETRADGAQQALAWYDAHLREAPNGAYASEALGRKMTVLARLGNRQAARSIADAYLQRYPGGSYAAAARALADQP